MRRLLFRSLCFTLILSYTAVFVLQDASYAMHSGSTDSASNFSSDVSQASATQNFQTDLFTGSATTSVPIFIPPGRKGVQPALALTYSSFGQNGWLGVGWMLEVGYIQRSTKEGPPEFNSSDTYLFSFQGISSSLVNTSGSEYRAKNESGSFLKFEFNGSSWTVWDKNGTRYSFGASSSSRNENTLGTFKWCLDRVTDTNGNDMTVSYWKDAGQIYLQQIAYTGNEVTGEAPTHTVDFISQTRPDLMQNFMMGENAATQRRLSQIDVKASGELARRYLLSYVQSSRTGRSLLSTITEFGTDGVTSLPPIQFFYNEADNTTFSLQTSQGVPSSDNAWNIQTGAADLFHSNESLLLPNGNFVGACSSGSGNGTHVNFGTTYTGVNGSESGASWTMNLSNGTFTASGGRDTHFHAWTYLYVSSARTISLDKSSWQSVWGLFLNGYLWSHWCTSQYQSGSTVTVNLQQGWNLLELTGYNQNNSWSFNLGGSLTGLVDLVSSSQFIQPQLVGDFNGDGIADLAEFTPQSGALKVSLSCSVNCYPPSTWISGFGNSNTTPLVGDFNRDGKSDVCLFDKEAGSWKVALSNGLNAFSNQGLWLSNWGAGLDPISGDFDGDGFQDIGTFNKPSGSWAIALSNGSSFASSGSWLSGWGSDQKPLTGDFNGDGLTDLLYVNTTSGSWVVSVSNGNRFIQNNTAWASGFGAGEEPLAVDANGDGLTDIGYYRKSTGLVKVKLSNGVNAFTIEKDWVNFTLTGDFTFQPGDFSGDGLVDPAIFNPTTTQSQMARSSSSTVDTLSRLENGRGGLVRVSYRCSTLNDNTGDDDIPDLPLNLALVDEVTLEDGLGSSYTTRYSFMHGLFDSNDRELRGFRDVRVTDPENNASITVFLQDDTFKGRVQNQEAQDGFGNKYARTENVWALKDPPPYPGVEFVYLSGRRAFVFDGDAASQQTYTTFQYDGYGNVREIQEEGDEGTPGDERTTVNAYAPNDSAYIVNRLRQTTLYKGLGTGGAIQSDQMFYYDGSADDTTPPTQGNLTTQKVWLSTDNTWPSTTMTYDSYGNVLTVTDARGFATTNTYDATYHTYVTQIQNALGHTRQFTYDARLGQVLTSTDANGQTTTTQYDALGRVVAVIGPLDSAAYPSTSYEYNLTMVPNRVTIKQRIEHGQSPTYDTYSFIDGLGRTIQNRLPGESNQQVVTGSVEFDARGQVSAQYTPYFDSFSTGYIAPSPSNKKTTFEYDPVGRRTQTTFPDGSASEVSYQDWRQTTTDPNGNQKEYRYEAYGRLQKVLEFNGGETYTTVYAYDTLGNLTQTTDHLGNTTTIQYDSFSRKLSMSDPDMGDWSYSYDPNGNLTSQTDAKGQTISFTYDALNRVTQKTGPGLSVTYTYDTGTNGIGRLARVQDSSGTTSFTYDVLGRTTSETKTVDLTPYTFSRTYDALSRLKTLTYPDGEVVTYTYNGLGDVETITGTLPQGGTVPYVTNVNYNAAGQITAIDYGNGTSTDYTYNPETLRLSQLVTSGPSGMLQDLSYTFDAVGNVLQITDSVNTATQSFGYDDLNRLTSATGSYGAFSYQYNPIGNMTYKEGRSFTYTDPNHVHAVTATSDGYSYSYDANGNLTQKLAPGGGVTTYSYDTENRLTSVETPDTTSTTVSIPLKPGWNFISIPVIPDNASDPDNVQVTEALSTLTFGADYDQLSRRNPQTDTFEHYVANPLYNSFSTLEMGVGYQVYLPGSSNVTWSLSGTPLGESESLELKSGFNLIGNPCPQDLTVQELLNNLVEGLDYDRVFRYNIDQIAPPGEGPPEYLELSSTDTVRVGESVYLRALRDTSWFLPSHLTRTTFTYDGDGGRVKKTVGSQETIYVGSLYEKQGASTTKYVMLGSQRIAAKDSQGTSFYHTDHLGGTNVVTNSTGAQTQLLEYKPYGALQRNEGIQDKEHKFTGQRLDASTGLYFYNARYYDPEIGRFISADTIVPNPANPQDLNRYTYANNNPINYVDPTGHGWFKKFWQSIVGAASLVLSILAPPLAPALWAVNTGISAATAIQTGNVLGFVGGLAGGWAFGGLGHDIGLGFASGMGKGAYNFFGGALSGAVEFGISGFGAGLGAGLASGESFSDSLKFGGQGALSGAIIGAAIQGSYMAGWQETLHGMSVPEVIGAQTRSGNYNLAHFNSVADTLSRRGSRYSLFRHYGYSDEAALFAGGMKAGSYGTTDIYTSGSVAQQMLALPPHRLGDLPPDAFYNVAVDLTKIQVQGPSQVAGRNWVHPKYAPQGVVRTGGGTEVRFPTGTPSGSVTYGGQLQN